MVGGGDCRLQREMAGVFSAGDKRGEERGGKEMRI